LISLVSKIGTRNAATGVAGNLQGSEIQDIPIADNLKRKQPGILMVLATTIDRSTVDALPKFIGSTLATTAF